MVKLLVEKCLHESYKNTFAVLKPLMYLKKCKEKNPETKIKFFRFTAMIISNEISKYQRKIKLPESP